MDRLHAIAVFLEVAERGSFVAAAKALNLSRTATSRSVADLEAYLGTTLLQRTTRRIALTDAGRVYRERARHLLDMEAEARNEASRDARTARGRLRVAAPLSFGVRYLAPRIGEFLRAHPDIELDLTLNDRTADLLEERQDVAIRIGRLAPSTLMTRRLSEARLMLCAAPAYLEAHGAPETPEDLSGHVCLGYPYAAGADAWVLLAADGAPVRIPVRNRLWCDNGDALDRIARSGLGIVYQPDFIVGEALESGALVQVLPAYRGQAIDVSVVFPPATFMPLRLRAFIDFMVAALADR